MAFIPVPDTWEVRVESRLTSAPNQINTYHYKTPPATALSQARATLMASGIEDAYESSGLNTYLSTAWSIDNIRVTELATVTGLQFQGVFDALSGLDSTEILPPQIAAGIEWFTALRGRSFRGRTFHGGFCEDGSNTAPVAGLITALGSFATALGTDFTGLGIVPSVVSRYSGTHLVAGPGGQTLRRPLPRVTGLSTPITSHSIETVWNTIRRRSVQG
jgi:hypothetical protein